MSALAIAAVTPFSSVDWPGKLSATVFLQGCPWRCQYCHNASLQQTRSSASVPADGQQTEAQFFEWLRTRVGLLDAVILSGGEPLLQPGIVEFISRCKSEGFAVGLHTGGCSPSRLSDALGHLDWVGFDYKAPFDRYEIVTQVHGSGAVAEESFRALISSGVNYETRTCVDSTLLTGQDLRDMGDYLSDVGVVDWVHATCNTLGADGSFAGAMPLVPYKPGAGGPRVTVR